MILLTVILFLIIYTLYRIISPIYYWKSRKVYYVNPLYRVYLVFFGGKSFAEIVKQAYDQFPDRRYYGSYQFLKPSLFIRDVDLIKQITIKDFEYFTDHVDILNSRNDPIFSKNLFSSKGKEWRELRSTLSPAFTSSKMKAMFVLISETAKKFVEHFEALNEDLIEVEMKETYSKFTNDVIATCAFGINCDTLENPDNEFFSMGKALTRTSPVRMTRTLFMMFFPKVFEILGISSFPSEITGFFKRIITDTILTREKANTVRPDLIHLLMEARKGKLHQENSINTTEDTGFATAQESKEMRIKSSLEITDDLITAQALIFFLAGLETSSSLLGFLSYELAKNPDIQKKLIKEVDESLSSAESYISYEKLSKMKYLDQVVSESLRKWTPGFGLNRVCTKDYTIPPKKEGESPVTISKGCFVMIPVIGIHYDPQYFENPDVFDPERFNDENKKNILPGSYNPFGIGPRNCIEMFQTKPPEYKEFEDDRYQFNDESIRKAFIRKVYLILMLQMIVSLGIIACFMYNEPLRFYVETNFWPFLVAFLVTLIVVCTLGCYGDVRRQFPLNMILLGVFTVAEGFILGIISAMTNSKIVLMAVGITAVVFLGLTLFSFQTRWDFTLHGGILSVCLIVLLVFGIIALIFPGRTMILIYSAFGAILFGCYMVYDTQMLMGGDHHFAISPEEYIFAVLALYLDVVNFFISILTILSASRRH